MGPSDEVDVTNPIELLASRRWESALFTTYALSLTFFETVVLRALRQQGCRDIWILADAEGYRASLAERRSMRVGQEYRLVPVALPKGVLHAKSTYLRGPDGDLLLIGSGNLTFGGFGRNVEVLEILEPQSSRAAFRDFAEFLITFSERADITIPDLDWLRAVGNDAASAAHADESSAGNDGPRLLHSVDRPIADQLADAIGTTTRVTTILSPFHDPSGTAVRELATRLSSRRIRIGLPAKQGELTTFPFEAAARWNLPIEAVRLADVHGNRPLHAKWIEIEVEDHCYVLTGSVNATSRALLTTKNIELGVLRKERRSRSQRWKRVEMPQRTKMLNYEPTGDLTEGIIYASLGTDAALEGQIIGRADFTGTWTGTLRASNQASASCVASVDNAGRFRCHVENCSEIAFAPALQIEMGMRETRARGWVHRRDLLEMTGVERLGVTTLARLISGDGTDDDAIALLEYLSIAATKHAITFSQPFHPSTSRSNGENAGEVSIDLSQLAPQAEAVSTPRSLASFGVSGDPLSRVFAALRRTLLGRKGVSRASAYDPSADTDDQDQAESIKIYERIVDALALFDTEMSALISEESLDETHIKGLLVMWLEVGVAMRLERLQDHAGTLSFLKDWFWRAAKLRISSRDHSALHQHVCVTACVLAALSERHDQLYLSQLHEGLECFCGGTVDRTYARSGIEGGSATRAASILLEKSDADLAAILNKILSVRTLRQELLDVLRGYEAGAPIRADSPLFVGSLGQEFLMQLRRKPLSRFYRELPDERLMCAHCHRQLTFASERDLEHRRIARCEMSCHRWAVRTRP